MPLESLTCPKCGSAQIEDSQADGSYLCLHCGSTSYFIPSLNILSLSLDNPCPNCGFDNSYANRYCSSCGIILFAVCQFCGDEIPLGLIYCPNCGKLLSGVPQTSIQEIQDSRDAKIDLVIQDLAWICPRCESRNMKSVALHSRLELTCQTCSKFFVGASGFVIWHQLITSQQDDDIFLDWIIRLEQEAGNMIQFAFTLRTPDFAIVEGDYLVVLSRSFRPGKAGVDYIENKTTGHILFPSK